MDISETVLMSLKTWTDFDLEDSLLESCKVAPKAGLMMSPLATLTVVLDVVWATWEQCSKELGWSYWAVATVLGRAFDVTDERVMVGVLRDIIFALLCLTSTAPICHSVMLYHL